MKTKCQRNNTETSDMYSGWFELYEAGSEGVPAWSEAPPPFLEDLKPFLRPGTVTLETCCGDGRITNTIVGWDAQVTALDLSPVALKQLVANFKHRGMPPPLTVVGSAIDIPLGDGQFDAVICVNGLCQIHRPHLAIQEAARVLRPGGKYLFDVFTPRDATFGSGEQIAAQDFLFKGCLFRYYFRHQFEPLFRNIFRVAEMFEAKWSDPAHGTFRPTPHDHHALVYILEKI